MLDVFLEVILPVLAMAALGGAVARHFEVPVKALSGLTFQLFTPALVFSSLAAIELDGDVVARIVAVMVIAFAATGFLTLAVTAMLRLERSTRSALTLTTTVQNLGNMGLPVAVLAFGQPGLDVAVVAFVTGTVLSSSVGVAIASMASGSARQALSAPFLVPALWAAVAGLVVNVANVDLPVSVEAVSDTLGAAAVPVMLTVLGLQLAGAPRPEHLRVVSGAIAVRLLGGPLIAWLATLAVGLEGVARDTLIVLGGMPTAVLTTILATQYDSRPRLVTHIVIGSTLVSILTLTVLIDALR